MSCLTNDQDELHTIRPIVVVQVEIIWEHFHLGCPNELLQYWAPCRGIFSVFSHLLAFSLVLEGSPSLRMPGLSNIAFVTSPRGVFTCFTDCIRSRLRMSCFKRVRHLEMLFASLMAAAQSGIFVRKKERSRVCIARFTGGRNILSSAISEFCSVILYV